MKKSFFMKEKKSFNLIILFLIINHSKQSRNNCQQLYIIYVSSTYASNILLRNFIEWFVRIPVYYCEINLNTLIIEFIFWKNMNKLIIISNNP